MTAARSPRPAAATAAASAPVAPASVGPARSPRSRPGRDCASSPGAPGPAARSAGAPPWCSACFGSFAALVASVAIQSQRIALQEEADRLVEQTAEARDHNRDLRISVIQAESPEHVPRGGPGPGSGRT